MTTIDNTEDPNGFELQDDGTVTSGNTGDIHNQIHEAAIKAMKATNLCTKHSLYHGQKYRSCTPQERVMVEITSDKTEDGEIREQFQIVGKLMERLGVKESYSEEDVELIEKTFDAAEKAIKKLITTKAEQLAKESMASLGDQIVSNSKMTVIEGKPDTFTIEKTKLWELVHDEI